MTKWYQKEDSWSIVLGCFIFVCVSFLWFFDLSFVYKALSIKFGTWESFDTIFSKYGLINFILLYVFLLSLFSLAAKFLGYKLKSFMLSFTLLYVLSIGIFLLSSHAFAKKIQLETPLLALIIGLVLSNFFKLPAWFKESLKTEFYVKTGIVIMGGSIPLMLLFDAGMVAILQACIITIITFFSIFFFATKIFKLDPSFGATLGGGGSICGVSAAIVIGNSCKAKPEYISASISIVVFWAVIMVFVLPILCRALNLDAGVAGAWIGTSEFADAAGLAAAANLNDDRAITAFTLIKVLGRDMFIGVWAVLVAFLSIAFWDKKADEKIKASIVWDRFPKFILGFLGISFLGFLFAFYLQDEQYALYQKEAIASVKVFRDWIFALTFLCIGLSANFRQIISVGYKPFLAFTLGVMINLPLGFVLSNFVFVDFWTEFLKDSNE